MIHWILILLIVAAWGRLIVTLLRLFSYKLCLPIRSVPEERSITKLFAYLSTIALMVYFLYYGFCLNENLKLITMFFVPFIFEELVLSLLTRNRAYLDANRMYDTRNGIVQYDLDDIFAVKIAQDSVQVFTHSSPFAFLIFYRLDYSVNDWELIQDYFHKYHGAVTAQG